VTGRYIAMIVTGMDTPTATTWSTHRSIQRGSLRGHTSKRAKTVVAVRPRVMARRKSEDGGLFK
jgi:hypothetical protein